MRLGTNSILQLFVIPGWIRKGVAGCGEIVVYVVRYAVVTSGWAV